MKHAAQRSTHLLSLVMRRPSGVISRRPICSSSTSRVGRQPVNAGTGAQQLSWWSASMVWLPKPGDAQLRQAGPRRVQACCPQEEAAAGSPGAQHCPHLHDHVLHRKVRCDDAHSAQKGLLPPLLLLRIAPLLQLPLAAPLLLLLRALALSGRCVGCCGIVIAG